MAALAVDARLDEVFTARNRPRQRHRLKVYACERIGRGRAGGYPLGPERFKLSGTEGKGKRERHGMRRPLGVVFPSCDYSRDADSTEREHDEYTENPAHDLQEFAHENRQCYL
jgi:hypothetical protein